MSAMSGFDAFAPSEMAECSLPFRNPFFKGMLCNVLVCMSVWMAPDGGRVFVGLVYHVAGRRSPHGQTPPSA